MAGAVPQPSCPRCGYDQSGAVAAWERLNPPQCPLEGVCSECGLELAWVDVMRPDRERIRGFFEHAVFPGQFVVWPFRTLGLALVPLRFWSRVRLAMRPVLRRMLCWPLLVILLPWALSGIFATLGMSMVLSRRVGVSRWSGDEWASILNCWIWPLGLAQAGFRRPFAPASFWVQPTAFGYMILALLASIAAWPLAMLVLGDTLKSARLRKSHLLRAGVYSLAPLSLLAWARVAASLLIVAAAILESGARSPRSAGLVLPPWVVDGELQVVALAALLLWLAVWWHQAIGRGFRLRHALAVWALMLILTVLVGLTVAEYSGPWLNRVLMKFYI